MKNTSSLHNKICLWFFGAAFLSGLSLCASDAEHKTHIAGAGPRVQLLLSSLASLQSAKDSIEITLPNEEIHKWTVKFLYPENRIIILNFEFHLYENLPPKILVAFPSSLRYVCFQELGQKAWTANNPISTLIFAIQNQYKDNAAVYHEILEMREEEAIAQWRFVQGAHKDWEYLDITELNSKFSPEDIKRWREMSEKMRKAWGDLEMTEDDLEMRKPENRAKVENWHRMAREILQEHGYPSEGIESQNPIATSVAPELD